MNPKIYLENKLKEIYSKFDWIQIRYENRKSTNSHLIEVIPLAFFEENKDYMIEEDKLENEFELLFPSENIVFVSKDSLTKIKHADIRFGYKKITINYNLKGIEFEVPGGFSKVIYTGSECNYALAA